jgi:hypothetical protein
MRNTNLPSRSNRRPAIAPAGCASLRSARSPGRKSMSLSIRRFAVSLALCLGITGAAAQEMDRQQMKGLDEQVQDIKTDVLGIAAELNLLEEKLLYPSGTQLAVFVALTQGDTVRLDAVQIRINGEPVAHYIYSFKELEALRKGGVQRIYVGNVPTGSHRLEVSVGGKLEGGADYNHTGQFSFDKGVGPKLVGLTVSGPGSGREPIELGNW